MNELGHGHTASCRLRIIGPELRPLRPEHLGLNLCAALVRVLDPKGVLHLARVRRPNVELRQVGLATQAVSGQKISK